MLATAGAALAVIQAHAATFSYAPGDILLDFRADGNNNSSSKSLTIDFGLVERLAS